MQIRYSVLEISRVEVWGLHVITLHRKLKMAQKGSSERGLFELALEKYILPGADTWQSCSLGTKQENLCGVLFLTSWFSNYEVNAEKLPRFLILLTSLFRNEDLKNKTLHKFSWEVPKEQLCQVSASGSAQFSKLRSVNTKKRYSHLKFLCAM